MSKHIRGVLDAADPDLPDLNDPLADEDLRLGCYCCELSKDASEACTRPVQYAEVGTYNRWLCRVSILEPH